MSSDSTDQSGSRWVRVRQVDIKSVFLVGLGMGIGAGTFSCLGGAGCQVALDATGMSPDSELWILGLISLFVFPFLFSVAAGLLAVWFNSAASAFQGLEVEADSVAKSGQKSRPQDKRSESARKANDDIRRRVLDRTSALDTDETDEPAGPDN